MSGFGTSVSKAEIRAVKTLRRRRARQMSLDRRQQARGAERGAEFRTGNLLHGLHQRRKPRHFAISGAPLLRLLDHRLHLALKPPPGLRRYQPARRKPVPGATKKTSDICDLLHKQSDRSALNPRHDPESIPTFIPAVGRYPRRLRPDRQQRCSGPFRADLPRSGLTRLEADAHGAAARQTRRVVMSTRPRDKVQPHRQVFHLK